LPAHSIEAAQKRDFHTGGPMAPSLYDLDVNIDQKSFEAYKNQGSDDESVGASDMPDFIMSMTHEILSL
jgi:hypothetical protein